MFSVIRQSAYLTLITYIHITSVLCSIGHHSGGYVYQAPAIKSLQITSLPSTATTALPSPPTLDTINEIESIVSKQSSAPAVPYTLNLNPFNFGLPSLSHNFLTDNDDNRYLVDGRILKQYEVMEDIPGDYIPENLLNKAPLLLSSLLAKFSRISPSLIPESPQFRGRQQQSPFINIQPVTRNHGPVALGSGALGYIRLPNGGIYLGSGSLGYISGPERIREINDARMRRIIQPSPVLFGTTHLNK